MEFYTFDIEKIFKNSECAVAQKDVGSFRENLIARPEAKMLNIGIIDI